MAKVGLIAAMNYSAVPEDEFNDWYNSEHILERRRIPGFLTCERWIDVDNNKISLGSYDLENKAVLVSKPYAAVANENATPWTKRVIGRCQRMFRIISEQVTPGDQLAPPNAKALLLSICNIAPEFEAEFADWFDAEHLPRLAAVPGTLSARRFVSLDGSHRHVALYHLANAEVPTSAAWKQAARTPWADVMVPRYLDRIRLVFSKPD